MPDTALDGVLARLPPDEPIHLVGHSLGALLGVELAARAPTGRMASLTTFALPYFRSEPEVSRSL